MSDFSPQAQAVLDASHFPQRWEHAIGAALRAAADQVVLKCPEPKWNSSAEQARWFACNDVRDHLLAIAGELDGGAQ